MDVLKSKWYSLSSLLDNGAGEFDYRGINESRQESDSESEQTYNQSENLTCHNTFLSLTVTQSNDKFRNTKLQQEAKGRAARLPNIRNVSKVAHCPGRKVVGLLTEK